MTDYGYFRVSTSKQSGDGEKHVLISAGVPEGNVYSDIGISGMKHHDTRPGFSAMRAQLRAGDVVHVPELSRLGRDVRNVLALVDDFNAAGIALVIHNLGGQAVDTRSAMGKMILTVFASLAQMERDLISERTTAALAERRDAGVQLGAPRKLSHAQAGTVATMKAAGMTPADIATALRISPRTVYRYLSRA